MTITKLVDGPLFGGQVPRQILVQSNGHVWAMTATTLSEVMHLYKSTDSGQTFEINTTFDIDVGDGFIAEDADGRLWRITFYQSPQQWLLERSDSGSGNDWTIIGTTPAADISITGPTGYYDNTLNGLVCHPTNADILAFAGSSMYFDGGSYVYGACPIWVVTDGETINQYILPMTSYELSGLTTNDVLFTQDGRLLATYSYWQVGGTRIVSCAYSDDYSSFTEVQLLPEYNIDDFGWYEHLYIDADGIIYCAFGRDVPTAGEHCWMWDLDGNCTANQIVYERGVFFVKSEDGITWTLIGDWHVPESVESGYNQPLPAAPDYLYQTYVPGSNIAGMMHDGTLLHVWFQSWQGTNGPQDPGLSIYWTYDGSSWTEHTMFGPAGLNSVVFIGSLSQRARITA